MVYTNKHGNKKYERPKMKVVMIKTTDIIATSGGTGGNIEGPGGLDVE